MSSLGLKPQAVAEPVSSPSSFSDPAAPARLPRPATVRLDRVVWIYVIPGRDNPSLGLARLDPLAL